MDEALSLIGPVAHHAMPPDSRGSQSLLLAVTTWWRLRSRAAGGEILVVEVAGRGIAETWAAWLLVRSGHRLWLTVHDAPAVSGAPLLTRVLDRQGLRRVGMALSRTVGRRVERDLLRRAEMVLALSANGAQALEAAYELDRKVCAVPHVAIPAEAPTSEPRILVPGYVPGPDAVLPLVRALPQLPAEWRLVVGAGPAKVSESVMALADELGVRARVELLGFVDEQELESQFDRAAIVVRWKPDGWTAGAARWAVSGPVVRALARGCVVVTNDQRGVTGCLVAARAVVVGDGETGADEMMQGVIELSGDDALRSESILAGLAHVRETHSPRAVAARLRASAP